MTSDLPLEPVSMRPTARTLDDATASAVREFLGLLKGDNAPVDALVFGSRARGDHHSESDIDVAVILEGTPRARYRVLREMSDAAYDVLLKTWLRIQPLPLWSAEFDQPNLFSNPGLIEVIKRDGLRLWKRKCHLRGFAKRDRLSQVAACFLMLAIRMALATVPTTSRRTAV